MITSIAGVSLALSMCMTQPKYHETKLDNLYPTTCTVYDITEDIVTVQDFQGNLFSFISDDADYSDIYSIIMDSKGTETLTDDEIKSVKLSGYIEKGELW